MPIEVMPKPPEDPVVLAEAIRRVSGGMKKLTRSGLNRDAVIVLLQHTTKVSRKMIERILNDLEMLERRFTTPQPVARASS